MRQSFRVRRRFRESISSIEMRVVLALDANQWLSGKVTFTCRKDQSAPSFFHLGDRPVLAIYDPSDIAQLLRLTLDEIECSFANRSDDQFPRGKGLEK